jgi:phosphate:Na+ symporter
MNIHRSDIVGKERVKDLVKRSREEIDVDIEGLYLQKVKTIYSSIIEYATLAQSQFTVSSELTRQFAQIKLANRNIVESIKILEQIRGNINMYLTSSNIYIQKEYDRLRNKITKILRELYLLQNSDDPSFHLTKLQKLKSKAEKSDVLFNGTLDELIRERKITSAMASSLVNDSQNVALISKKLITAGELIYTQNDTLLANEIKK